ncbi:MAG TPA: motility protein A [Ruminiclostridium sp.]|jgi:chemotaxis protein MotA|nr:motility protein A [Ruminiclostridium sp.]
MELGSLIGLIGGIAVLLYGMLTGGELSSFLDVPSIVVTMGGGLVCTIFSYPLSDSTKALRLIPLVFKAPKSSAIATIQTLVSLSQKARREGLLALESAQEEINDDFLKKAMELVVDGIEADIVKTTMQLDIDSMASRHQNGQAYFKTMAAQFPAWGMIGTLLGLVNLLRTLDDPSTVGPAMALAIITTFYGSVMANFVCNPIATKLAGYSAEEISLREMMMEGVLSIQSGENPRLMEQKLKTFLSPKQRDDYDALHKNEQERPQAVGAQ